jgi:hypothetical protein
MESLDPSDANDEESDPDAMAVTKPQHLLDNPNLIREIHEAITEASRCNTLAHGVLGHLLPLVHAHLSHTAPPIRYSDLRDSTYAAAATGCAGQTSRAFTIAGIVTPTNDVNSEGAPNGKVVQPGHNINYPEKTPAIINWCVAAGFHKRVRLNIPTIGAMDPPGPARDPSTPPTVVAVHPSGLLHDPPSPPAVVALGPPGPLRDPTGRSVDDPADTTQTIAVQATRQEPSVPAEVAALVTLLRENLSIGQEVEFAPREPNPHPWVEEPQALQRGPLTGFSVTWLVVTSAAHSETHC